ncbi:UNVERIFIED_CONTAM: hypothetical protein HDU68_006796, partial [Siphonaria sp. JEL0065]
MTTTSTVLLVCFVLVLAAVYVGYWVYRHQPVPISPPTPTNTNPVTSTLPPKPTQSKFPSACTVNGSSS